MFMFYSLIFLVYLSEYNFFFVSFRKEIHTYCILQIWLIVVYKKKYFYKQVDAFYSMFIFKIAKFICLYFNLI